jgi:hypothetical protein
MRHDTCGFGRWIWSSRPGRRSAPRSRRSDPRRLLPALLELEDRRLLSTFTVNSIADTMTGGSPTKGTLRWAVEQADSAKSPSTIIFQTPLFATPQTITLTQGQLDLSNKSASVTITGPAAGVTISGDGLSRVFQVEGGVTATLSGLTITQGHDAYSYGGGGLSNKGTANLDDCTISGNYAVEAGGGLYNEDGTTNLNDCTISGNSCFIEGGGLFNSYGTAILTDCTITGNSAGFGGGGGLYNGQNYLRS